MSSSTRFHHCLPAPQSQSASSTDSSGLSREITSAKGTLPFLRPTHAHVHFDAQRLDWNSRDHRKGRHPLRQGQRRRISTVLRLEWWNISWWVAFLFTAGSAVWVINGFFVFLPLLGTMSETNKAAGGWTAFTGGTLFLIGGYLMVLEALNRKHEVVSQKPIIPESPSPSPSHVRGILYWKVFLFCGCFLTGIGIYGKYSTGAMNQINTPSSLETHSNPLNPANNKNNASDNNTKDKYTSDNNKNDKYTSDNNTNNKYNNDKTIPDNNHSAETGHQAWKWFGTHWHEIGFIASIIQLFAATIFWISTVTGIPGVIDMNDIALTDGIFWVPQVIGGSGFIIASILFILETQPNWWHIRPFSSLGWHVGFWNLIGALGFALCGAFGIAEAMGWAEYQSSCSTFWGSWAFLIGSLCQWVECLNR